MEGLDLAFIRLSDDKLLVEDVELHARPFHVALGWIQQNKFSGNFFDQSIWKPLMSFYHQLYPDGDFSVPALLDGGVAVRDRMYRVRIFVGYGRNNVDPLKSIEINIEQLESIFKNYPDDGWRAFYSVCDLFDFAYGIDDLLKEKSLATNLLNNARSSLVATSRILIGNFDIDAVIQTTCLAAELSIKAALVHLGWKETDYRKLSHDLQKSSTALIVMKPGQNDELFLEACKNFPDYVKTRYEHHGLTRLQLMELAARAQFVAAEAIRRVSVRNMAGGMGERPDCPPRKNV